jgi:hypothetical protein
VQLTTRFREASERDQALFLANVKDNFNIDQLIWLDESAVVRDAHWLGVLSCLVPL